MTPPQHQTSYEPKCIERHIASLSSVFFCSSPGRAGHNNKWGVPAPFQDRSLSCGSANSACAIEIWKGTHIHPASADTTPNSSKLEILISQCFCGCHTILDKLSQADHHQPGHCSTQLLAARVEIPTLMSVLQRPACAGQGITCVGKYQRTAASLSAADKYVPQSNSL